MKIWFLASSKRYPFAFQVFNKKKYLKKEAPGKKVLNDLIKLLEENLTLSIPSGHIMSHRTNVSQLRKVEEIQCGVTKIYLKHIYDINFLELI